MKKLEEARISILANSEGFVTIELFKRYDTIFTITLTDSQFVKAMSRLAYVECKAEYYDNILKNLEKTKVVESKTIELTEQEYNDYKNRKQIAYEKAVKEYGGEWEVQNYFSSQDSFFNTKDKYYARFHVIKWIDKEKEK